MINYLLGLVIWCSVWTFRIIWIKTRFGHITVADSTLKIRRKAKRKQLGKSESTAIKDLTSNREGECLTREALVEKIVFYYDSVF